MFSHQTVIGFLLFTAVLLGCILVLEHALEPTPAFADASSRAGSLVVATAMIEADQDLLWVVNVFTRSLVAYGSDRNGRLAALASVDLGLVFAGPSPIPLRRQQVPRTTPQPPPTPPP